MDKQLHLCCGASCAFCDDSGTAASAIPSTASPTQAMDTCKRAALNATHGLDCDSVACGDVEVLIESAWRAGWLEGYKARMEIA